jgi:hypothetical protein
MLISSKAPAKVDKTKPKKIQAPSNASKGNASDLDYSGKTETGKQVRLVR